MSGTFKRVAGLTSEQKRVLLERLLREKARQSKSFPLSFAQERLWFLNQLEPGSPFYNVPVVVRLAGRLIIPALERTLNEIVSRHEILRTYFPMADGLPVQVIAPAKLATLPLVDLSELSEAERDLESRRIVSEEAQYGFDLTQRPALRLRLLRLGEEDHVAILIMHHIISDGWSMGILVQEIAMLYIAFVKGEQSPLPDLPIQYADYAVWQRQWLEGEVLQDQLLYWKQKLGGALPVLELPTDRPRPAIQSYCGDVQSMELEQALSASLKQLSRQKGVTTFMLMLAAFKVLLYRYSGQQDIVVGTPTAGRNRAEIEGLIGFFVNTLVMRSQLIGECSFSEVVSREKEVVLEAFRHQDVPFERLVVELQPARSLSYTPLFQVMFTLDSVQPETLSLPDLTLSTFEPDLKTAKFDLTLTVIDSQNLAVAIEYNTDLFDGSTISRMLDHFHNLLEGISANPEQQISTLPILSEVERHQLIFDWNDTAIDYLSNVCIHELFEAQVERTPDGIALVFDEQRLTYADLNRRANQLAHYLRDIGVGPEALVGICLERSTEMIIAVLGVLKAGGAYVPLDPDYPTERLAFIIEDAGVSVLLTERGLLQGFEHHVVKVVWLDSECEAIAKQKADNPASKVRAENLAYVIYTSGSTGQPKGVMIDHHGICNRLQWGQQAHPLTESDSLLQATSLSFDVSVVEVFPPLIAGARLVIARPGGSQDTAYLVKVMAEHKVTVANFVPSLLQVLIEEAGIDECKYLKQVVAGGEPLQSELKDRFLARLGAELYNLYGPTETSVDATSWRCDPGGKHGIVPIGRPLANIQTYILRPDFQPAPIGIPGELYIAGAGLAHGYLNRPDQTAEKFIPNPFSDEPGARMYKTGDVVRYLPDGNIEFISRVDYQVKVRGFRVELGEIEAVIAQYQGVKEVAVLAVDPMQLRASIQRTAAASVDNQPIIVAYIAPEQESALEAGKLRSFLKNKLPNYMLPSAFVLVQSLPLTLNGKIDRRALLGSGQIISGSENEFVTPRDLLELHLAHIWEDVLGVDSVGVHDNFFELGGHSLLAVRLMARIQQSFGKELPLATLFEGATVEHLACVLRRQAQPDPWSPLVAIKGGGSKRPFFCVHPAGGNVLCYLDLARHLDPDQPLYAFQSRGLSGHQPVCTNISEMVSLYIAAMRRVQPEGPYLLGGWSVGGIIAFELAHQLEAQGERVDLLVLIDTRAPEDDERFTEEDDVMVMASFGQHLGLALERLDISYDHFMSLDLDERLVWVMEEAKRAGVAPPDITLSQIRGLFEVFKANVKAVAEFAPRKAGYRIVLLEASERLTDAAERLAAGWDELTEDGIKVVEVPGNHFTMIREPHVRFTAERLSRCIDEATAIKQY